MNNLFGEPIILGKDSDHYSTPRFIYDEFIKRGYIDPNPLKSTEDCLKKDYHKFNLFINPPFSNIDSFVDWAINMNSKYFNTIYILMPDRVMSTAYFHKLLKHNVNIFAFNKRHKYGDMKTAAGFGTLIIELPPYQNDCSHIYSVTNENFMRFIK